ncbi:MAG: HEAT repeat domain-containing protein [Thermodesulfobacteriota bacterium]
MDLIQRLNARPPLPPFEEILAGLEDQDPRRRWLAADDLGRTGRVEAAPYLQRHLADRNIEVRRRARAALLRLGALAPPGFDQAFQRGLEGLDPLTELAARAVLDEIQGRTDQARDKYARVFAADPGRYWAAYHAMDGTALARAVGAPLTAEMKDIIEGLNDQLARPRETYPLSLLRQAYGLSVLGEALGQRLGAETFRLIESGRPEEAAALRRASSGLVALAREMGALAKGFELRLKDHLEDFHLSDDDPGRAREAALAEQRAEAARALGGFRTPEAQTALTAALRDDPSPLVRARAAEALGRIGSDQAGRALLEAFPRENHAVVRQVMVQALGGSSLPEAGELLYRLVRQDEYQEAALLALGRRGRPEDLAFLRQAAADPTFLGPAGPSGPDRTAVLSAVAEALEYAAAGAPDSEREDLRREAAAIRAGADTAGPAALPELRPAVPETTAAGEEENVRRQVESWLEAWRRQDLETLLGHYSPRFQQDGRDLAAFKAHKQKVLARRQHLSVTISDLKIEVRGSQATATFIQDYRADQYRDLGRKTLALVKEGGQWLIVGEKWRALESGR